jgi:hypothetical protein
VENLVKTHLMMRRATGTMSFFGQEIPFSDELTLQLPNKSRLVVEGRPEGKKTKFTIVCRGDKAWQETGGTVTEMTKDRLQVIQDELYVLWVASLAPLKTEKGFSFIALADTKVGDRDATSVLVSRQGRVDLKLAFDKPTGLLLKIERRAKQGGIPIDKEYFYSGYQRVGGVELPSKYAEKESGKKVGDVTSIEYRFLSRVDNSMFEKP